MDGHNNRTYCLVARNTISLLSLIDATAKTTQNMGFEPRKQCIPTLPKDLQHCRMRQVQLSFAPDLRRCRRRALAPQLAPPRSVELIVALLGAIPLMPPLRAGGELLAAFSVWVEVWQSAVVVFWARCSVRTEWAFSFCVAVWAPVRATIALASDRAVATCEHTAAQVRRHRTPARILQVVTLH